MPTSNLAAFDILTYLINGVVGIFLVQTIAVDGALSEVPSSKP